MSIEEVQSGRGCGQLLIVGSGGFARETVDLVHQIDPDRKLWRVLGLVSPHKPDSLILEQLGTRWLGNDETDFETMSASHFTPAIADPTIRSRVSTLYEARGIIAATLIHPTAVVGAGTQMGRGAILSSYVSITTNVTIGQHAHIDRSVTIGHDVTLDDFVTLHPACVISGGVHIASRSLVGANASLLPNIRVGRDAVIGAGAVVTRDVPDSSVVAGNPARPLSRY